MTDNDDEPPAEAPVARGRHDSAPSRSKARRGFAAQLDALDALLTGARTGPVPVRCRSPRCGKLLADVRYRDDVIEFIVIQPAHEEGDDLLVLDGGVSVVKDGATVHIRRDRPDQPRGVWRPSGPAVAIRCAVCRKPTPINMIALAELDPRPSVERPGVGGQ